MRKRAPGVPDFDVAFENQLTDLASCYTTCLLRPTQLLGWQA